MKLKVAALAGLVTAVVTTFTMGAFYRKGKPQTAADDSGHVLTELWTEFDKAVRQDRPKKQAEILLQIRSEAMKQKLAWDFYDASRSYVRVVSDRNWKLRDSLKTEFAGNVEKFGSPTVKFVWMADRNNVEADSMFRYLQAHAGVMKSTCNRAFYRITGRNYGPYHSAVADFLKKFYANDYEYALWMLLSFSKSADAGENEVYRTLKSYEGNSYPLGAYLDFLAADTESAAGKRNAALQAFADRFSGKAVSMWARSALLMDRFDKLRKDNASAPEFEALYDDCKKFEKERKAFRGNEAEIVAELYVVRDIIIKELESRSIGLDAENGKLAVVLRNLNSVHVTMKPAEGAGAALLDMELKNDACSFYVEDTLTVDIPDADDGVYVIEAVSGKNSNMTTYESYRISVALRTDSRGLCLYAADHESGKPIEAADISLEKKGKQVSVYKGLKFDGFTPLPEAVTSGIKGDAYYAVSCSYVDADGFLRKSRSISVNGRDVQSDDSAVEKRVRWRACDIYTDRGAYNPGDTVDFKAVIYYTDYLSSAEVSPAAAKYKVLLVDAEGNEVESLSLQTNDFGSIAGRFVIPRDRRNGYYTIRVVTDPEISSGSFSRSIRVDEFVLPTFDLTFDNAARQYLPGDEVTVTGKVVSYSGHPVSSAGAVYEVASYGKLVASGRVDMAPDGTFAVRFLSDGELDWASYRVTVKITDGTGETREFGKSVRVAAPIIVYAELTNAAEGNVSGLGDAVSDREVSGWTMSFSGAPAILKEEKAVVKFRLGSPHSRYDDVAPSPVMISYSLNDEDGKRIASGSVRDGNTENIDMKDCRSGLYVLKASASVRSDAGKEFSDTATLKILLVRDSDHVLDAPVKDLIFPLDTEVQPGDSAYVMFGTADGSPVWALADVFGANAELLETRMVHLDGIRGKEGSLVKLGFRYEDPYPDAIRVQMFYFRNSGTVSCGYEFRRAHPETVLPLEFSSFEDKTLPSSTLTFAVKTLPGVECLAAVFDKSTETIERNDWNVFRMRDFHARYVNVDACPGSTGGHVWYDMPLYENALYETVTVGATRRRYKSNSLYTRAEVPMADAFGSAAVEMDGGAGETDESGEIHVRENFANVLTFQPFLRSDADGNISFSFSTADKLSTYVVALYAHDKSMSNAALRREMTVTVPVKVDAAVPAYLYATDNYRLSVSVSSSSDKEVTGTLTMYVYKGAGLTAAGAAGMEPVLMKSVKLDVPAGKSAGAEFDLDVTSLMGESELPSALSVKLIYAADRFSDGMFVAIPVKPALQAAVESHSAVLLHGMDKSALIKKLRGEFVNASGSAAAVEEKSVMDMVRDAIPSKVEPAGNDVLSLSEAMYVRALSGGLRALNRMPEEPDYVMSDAELFGKVFACHNADGGFGWFEGMKSSPVITAVLLERFSKMLAAGLLDSGESVSDDAASCADVDAVMSSAVHYLDGAVFGASECCPAWCGGISDEQYMYVRSMFASVPFEVKPLAGKNAEKRMKDFRNLAKAYLLPRRERGLNGYALGKARRLGILMNLESSEDGIALAKTWGLGIQLEPRLEKSMDADMVSLLEYAVEHKDGGMYYPNAVMPFRGLLESEAYAHSLLCDLLTGYAVLKSDTPAASADASVREALRVADGIRLWLMLQKETQHWDAEPAFVDAVNSIVSGSQALKSTSVVTLTGTWSLPFEDIKAAGNGFSIDRRFFRETASASGKLELQEIKSGEMLSVGDKVVAQYRIHSDENRSFIKVAVPREASFRPVEQLSGHYGWWMSPLRVQGWYSFTPQGYRNVKADCTEYWFDSYPEENTVISEELFVTQAGSFSAPVPVVESLYAPHYRANSAFCGPLLSYFPKM